MLDFSALEASAKRYEESLSEFRAADAEYERNTAGQEKRLIAEFQTTFLGREPERSEINRDLAKETIQLTEDFNRVRMTAYSSVSGSRLNVTVTVSAIQVKFMTRFMELSAQALEQLAQSISKKQPGLSSLAGQLTDPGEQLARDTIQLSSSVIDDASEIQLLAATLIRQRSRTISNFASTHLELSNEELLRRLKEFRKTATKGELWSKAFDLIDEMIEWILDEELPVNKILRS